MTLVKFLHARLDEDEQVASAAVRYWLGIRVESATEHEPGHIARHDPARVLADVAAKRLLVEFWSRAYSKPSDFPGLEWDRVRANARWTLALLALPFASHPDYRPEWSPR